MSRAYRCDSCGKPFDGPPYEAMGSKQLPIGAFFFPSHKDASHGPSASVLLSWQSSFELCPRCLIDAQQVILGKALAKVEEQREQLL